MKRNVSSHSHRDEKCKSSRSEDHETGSRARTEEEKLRRRREWMKQKEREREHEKLKEKMILEYEIQRARQKGLPLPKRRLSHQDRSKNESRSPENRHRRTATSNTCKTSILSEKVESSDGTTSLFKGPEGIQVSATELRRIKVDIHRKIMGKTTIGELQRDIINPEDVVLKRRTGEGSKPIFEREEIKGSTKTEEIEEHRTVVAINNENLENKSKTCKKFATSSSPLRSRSRSPRRTSHHSRYDSSKHSKDSYRNDRDRSRGKSKEYQEKDRRHGESRDVEEDHLRERKSHQDHSRSREREERKWDRDSCHRFKDERYYREYQERSRGRSRERRDRDTSRERGVPTSHYFEQIHVPLYYSNFSPRPIMVGPLVPMRGQVPLSSRHMMSPFPLRPFPPRFIPPDMYRLRPPPNPRFGPMY
ncbi:PREDICTED: peptidyl-prolyl cis-trans isomerase G-like [Eufriesea mexicana]|uniref:peptidyl-prolyl cis-trans isomerase G-like n=1 Tax=Eufriesea mexicana TaxID=516756 RepID=UPI00083BB55F|nr:PREDICTED: peptidyl-prolyl cis-trans isomerase G-like [Eufriesea mexicana]